MVHNSPAVPDENSRTFWGKAITYTAVFTAMGVTGPAAFASGAISAAKGETFDSGFDNVMNKVIDSIADPVNKAADFGDKHGDTITKSVISGVITVAISAATGGSHHRSTSGSGAS